MKVFPTVIVVVSALAAASAADAQWRSERPYRGLFAGGVADTGQLLTASGSLGTGWSENLLADAMGRNVARGDLNQRFRGGVSTASGSLSYSLNRSAVAFGATGGTTARYYPSLSDRFITRQYGSVGTSAILGRGFTALASAVYQPFTLRSMMPQLFDPRLGDPAFMDEDFPASLEHYFGYSAGGGYTRNLTRRQTFAAAYNYRAREAVGTAPRFEYHRVDADLTFVLSRDLNLRLGYGYAEGRFGGRNLGSHIIDAGVDYSHALSFSRRTTLSFGTGSIASRRSRSDALRFHATGAARLNHEIGRTWNAGLSYNRGLQFVETWPEPIFSDSAVAEVGGSFNNRVQLHFSAQAIRGRGYFNPDGNRIESYVGAAALGVGLTRHVNTGVNYIYYRHHFADRALLPPGFVNDLDGQSIRAFVSMWVPLFQSMRRR